MENENVNVAEDNTNATDENNNSNPYEALMAEITRLSQAQAEMANNFNSLNDTVNKMYTSKYFSAPASTPNDEFDSFCNERFK